MAPVESEAASAYLHATAVGSLTVLTAYFAWQVHGFIAAHLAQLARSTSGEARVIVVEPTYGYYAGDLVQNDPFMRGPVVILLTSGPDEDERVVSRYFPTLSKLSADYRGSVWGRPDRSQSVAADVRGQQHREKK